MQDEIKAHMARKSNRNLLSCAFEFSKDFPALDRSLPSRAVRLPISRSPVDYTHEQNP